MGSVPVVLMFGLIAVKRARECDSDTVYGAPSG